MEHFHTTTAVVSTTPLKVDWDALIIPLTREEIDSAIRDDAWQRFRVSMLGQTVETRYYRLRQWIEDHRYPSVHGYRQAQIQVANYINALKRGGMVK